MPGDHIPQSSEARPGRTAQAHGLCTLRALHGITERSGHMSQLFDEEIQRELVALSRQLPNDDRLADRIINAAQVGSRSPRRRRVAVGPWLAAAAVVVGV